MSRKTSSILWLCLLLLLPVSVVAQTLEYWFDDDFDNRSSVSIATETEQELSLNLQNKTQFPPGFHKLNMRAIVGGKPTAVSSSDVLKIAAGDISLLEYWVDDDRDNVRTIGGKEANTGGSWQFLSDFDLSDVPVGFHYLNCRAVSNSRLTATAVTTTGFFKMPSGVVTHLQYWIDDDITNAKTIEGKEANTGGSWQFLSNLDLSAVSPGFHKLNCRAVSTNNQLMSSVSSTGFYKNALGNITHIEYWLDNDRKNIQTVAVNASEDGSTFGYIKDFNLTTASPGHHKVHFRAVSADRKTSSAVTTTAVNVKPRDVSSNLVMSGYTVAVDNNEETNIALAKKKPQVDIPYVYDARGLSVGNHTLTMSFYNSAGGMTSIQEPFKVVATENNYKIQATLTGTIWNGDGYTMDFNSIPNDFRYEVIEIGSDGKERPTWSMRRSVYPDQITGAYVEILTNGETSYYVKGYYKDKDGNEQCVVSNTVLGSSAPEGPPPSLEPEEEEDPFGTIYGQVVFEDRSVGSILPSGYNLKVKFEEDGVVVPVYPNGTFSREMIEKGTTLTMKIEDDDYYTFETASVFVDGKTKNYVIPLYATPKEEADMYIPRNDGFDLMATSFSHEAPYAFNFTLKNYSKRTWSGKLDIYVFEAEDEDEILSQEGKGVSFSSTGKPYYKIGSVDINNLGYAESTDLEIITENFPELDWSLWSWLFGKEDVPYVFYFVTQSDRDASTKAYKMLSFADDNHKNPLRLTLEPLTEGDIEKYRLNNLSIDDFILEILKYMSKCDKWCGSFTKAQEPLNKALYKYSTTGDLNKLYNEVPAIIISLDKDVRDIYKGVSNLKKELDPIRSFFKELIDIKDVMEFSKKDPYHRYTMLFKKGLDICGKYSNVPFVSAFKLYLDVSEDAVERILELQKELISVNMGNDFQEGYINFKIKVLNKHNERYYDATDVAARIKNVNVVYQDEKDNKAIACYSATGNKGSNEVVLQRTGVPQVKEIGNKTKRLWMEIEWKNGRLSKFPLDEEFTEWDKLGQALNGVTITLDSNAYQADHIDDQIYLHY